MKKKPSIYYIAELNLPSKSAYSIHVMKMCEAFSKLGFRVNLFVINSKNAGQIFKSYNLKDKFYINSIFSKFIELNFIYRAIFSIKILLKNFKQNSIFISRSIIFALIASVFNKKVILELHHEITGISKIFYRYIKK